MMKVLVVLVFATIVGLSYAKLSKRAAQNPGPWSALDQLRGKSKISNDEIFFITQHSKAGQDYPNLSEIPAGNFDCSQHGPGFYADVDTKCQVVRRCDVNGNMTSFLCPNMTIFNQITLVCHWFFEVDCSKSAAFYTYSNSRLYQEGQPLLDDEPGYAARRKRSIRQSKVIPFRSPRNRLFNKRV